MKVYVVNGSGRVGKDTFVDMCIENLEKAGLKARKYSSIDYIKEIAALLGWKGKKTDKDRKFLSDLKLLSSEYNDLPLEKLREYYAGGLKLDIDFIFFMIREPNEIAKAVTEFGSDTILVTNTNVAEITSNTADANVLNYCYDYEIYNNGSLEELRAKSQCFCNMIMKTDSLCWKKKMSVKNDNTIYELWKGEDLLFSIKSRISNGLTYYYTVLPKDAPAKSKSIFRDVAVLESNEKYGCISDTNVMRVVRYNLLHDYRKQILNPEIINKE
jgi:hypothetical protein